MQVVKLILSNVFDQLGGLLPGIANVFSVDLIWAYAVSQDKIFWSEALNDIFYLAHNGKWEGRPALKVSAPGVISLVGGFAKELLEQVVVGTVDLNSVKASFNGASAGLTKIAYYAFYLLVCKANNGVIQKGELLR